MPAYFHRIVRRIALSALLSSTLGACAISTPFPRIAAIEAPGGGDSDPTVVLVLTRVAVDPAQRAAFDRQTRLVIDSMPGHPGLLGYSARRELFGTQAWTVSVWRDNASRERFVKSTVHQRAIEESRPAIVRVELKRLHVRRAELPKDWTSALRLLEDPHGIRSYRN